MLHLPDSSELQRLAAARIPLVVIDPPEEPGAGIRSVGTTNWQGGLTATRHLIELGHRRIAIIGGPERLWSSRARLDGYRAALQAAGLARRPSDRGPPRPVQRRGRPARRAATCSRCREPPTAIVAGNDAQAFGVLQALGERGLRAPDDLSVVGFDDVPVASWATPALTTVRQPLAAMAATAFRMLRSGPGHRPGRRAAAHRAGHHAGRPGQHRAAPRVRLTVRLGPGSCPARTSRCRPGAGTPPRAGPARTR